MSEPNEANQIVLMFAADKKNLSDSSESIQKQKIPNLSKSDTPLKMDSLHALLLESEAFKSPETEAVSEKFPPPFETIKLKEKEVQEEKVLCVPAKLLSVDLTILRATLTPPESTVRLLDEQNEKSVESKTEPSEGGILEIIHGSEAAPKDRVPWKYLKRSSSYTKEKKKFTDTWLRTVHYQYSQELGRTRMNLRCLNCTLYVKTKIRHVSTIRTRRNACVLTAFGMCCLPYMLYPFKDVVHICPICNVYMGFCPAFKYSQKIGDVLTPLSLISVQGIQK